MTTAAEPDHHKYVTINFEETELRLGLPSVKGDQVLLARSSGGKRGFSQTVDLKLNLSSSSSSIDGGDDLSTNQEKMKDTSSSAAANSNNDPAKPPAKYVQYPVFNSTPFKSLAS